jgi:protein farnesyltransferase subunit beta
MPFAHWHALRLWVPRRTFSPGTALLRPGNIIHTNLCRHMDIPMLVSWLSARQSAPEGGLSGRTNKLVDGCYSHWVGGCWPLLESSLEGKPGSTEPPANSLFSREGLTRYILACCQGNEGGLRDKPGKYVFPSNLTRAMADKTDTLIHTTPAMSWLD